MTSDKPGSIAEKLLVWYRTYRHSYPWRRTKDPYRVWVSEILLQQTRIPIVLEYYDRIVSQYPTLQDLAAAEENAFLSLWSGIGYYRRARNMLDCARLLVAEHSGRFPGSFPALLKLPGIGPYTAGAIRNICFHQLTPAVDGNVRRVLARLGNSRTPVGEKQLQGEMERAFLQIGKGAPPAPFFQGLMELGQRICLPDPVCRICPVQVHCLAHRYGDPGSLPVRTARKKSVPYYWYLLILKRGNALYYARNASRAFLKEAWMLPDILCRKRLDPKGIRKRFELEWGIRISSFQPPVEFSHSVTFRRMTVNIVIPHSFQLLKKQGKWLTERQAQSYPTSSVTQKAKRALSNKQTEP